MSNDTFLVYLASKYGLGGYTLSKFGTLPVSSGGGASNTVPRGRAALLQGYRF
jgi:hypothetical protein